MARADYEKIKSEFEKLVLTFRSHDINIVKEVITDNANVQLESSQDYFDLNKEGLYRDLI